MYRIEIVERVKKLPEGLPHRPDLSQMNCSELVLRCIQECWNEDPDQRPDFKYIRQRLKPMQQGLYVHVLLYLCFYSCFCFKSLHGFMDGYHLGRLTISTV